MDNRRLSSISINLAKGFVYLSLLTPLILFRDLYFPFVAGKIIFFRFAVQGALLFLLAAFFIAPNREEFQLGREWRDPLTIAIIAFPVVFFISSFWGVNPFISLFSNFERGEGGIQMLHYLAFFIVLVLLFRSPREWRNLFIFSIAVSLLVCAYAFGQYREAACLAAAGNSEYALHTCHGGTFMGAATRVSATLGNPLYLAIYLSFNLFFVFVLMTNAKGKGERIVLGLIASLTVFFVFMTKSRSLLMGMMTAGLVLIPASYFIFGRKPPVGIKLSYLYGVLAMTLAGFIALSLFGNLGAHRFLDLFNTSSFSSALKDRMWVWWIAVSALMARPWGWGAENFTSAVDRFYDPRMFGVESWFDRVHNIFLDNAVSGGFLLLFVYSAIFVLFFIRAWQAMRMNGVSDQKLRIVILSCLFLIIYIVQGLASFDVVTTYQLLFMFLAYFIFITFMPEEVAAPDRIKARFKSKGKGSAVAAKTKPKAGENDLHGSKTMTKTRKGLRLLLPAVMAPVLAGCLYWLDCRPLQRNIAIAAAIRDSEWAVQETLRAGRFHFSPLFDKIRLNFAPALHSPSPVGGDESFIALSHLVNRIIVHCGGSGMKIPADDLLPLVDEINKEFAQKSSAGELIGSRHFLDLGNLNFNAARMTGASSYFHKAAALIDEGIKRAPTRMEFLLAGFEISLAGGNREEADGVLRRILTLRPDFRKINSDIFRDYERRFGAPFQK